MGIRTINSKSRNQTYSVKRYSPVNFLIILFYYIESIKFVQYIWYLIIEFTVQKCVSRILISQASCSFIKRNTRTIDVRSSS